MAVGGIVLVGKIGVVLEITGVENIAVSLWTLLHPAMEDANRIIMAICLHIVLKIRQMTLLLT